jgi:hypothetical protein
MQPKNVYFDNPLEAYKRRCCLCGTESEEQKGSVCATCRAHANIKVFESGKHVHNYIKTKSELEAYEKHCWVCGTDAKDQKGIVCATCRAQENVHVHHNYVLSLSKLIIGVLAGIGIGMQLKHTEP